jgi:hypothetical protein
MKRYDSTLLRVFLYGLPLVAVVAVFSYVYGSRGAGHAHAFLGFLNGLAGLIFAVWMILSIHLSVRLIFSASFRDQVITKLTFMRERDEREAMLAGKATRTAFLTSIAILILLFCLSCFKVAIYRVPPERAIDGRTGVVSLGLGFDLLEHQKQNGPEDTVRKNVFSYTGLPVSTATVILMLIAWQIAAYSYSIRRLTKRPCLPAYPSKGT